MFFLLSLQDCHEMKYDLDTLLQRKCPQIRATFTDGLDPCIRDLATLIETKHLQLVTARRNLQ